MSMTAPAVPGSLERIVNEGYGPGAWHGPDLKAALGGVATAAAFRRPAAGRHNIAEIALHHAFCARNVRAKLTGKPAEPFVLDGDDWFPADSEKTLTWKRVLEVVEDQHRQLTAALAAIEAGHLHSPLGNAERLDLVLGITCHAVYHAGQIQLIKRLAE